MFGLITDFSPDSVNDVLADSWSFPYYLQNLEPVVGNAPTHLVYETNRLLLHQTGISKLEPDDGTAPSSHVYKTRIILLY